MYYTYMIRCADGSVYTGITVDLERRTGEHIHKEKDCAKYTRSHNAVRLEAAWQSETRAAASRLEYRIKRLTKAQKEALISGAEFEKIFKSKLDFSEYKRIKSE